MMQTGTAFGAFFSRCARRDGICCITADLREVRCFSSLLGRLTPFRSEGRGRLVDKFDSYERRSTGMMAFEPEAAGCYGREWLTLP